MHTPRSSRMHFASPKTFEASNTLCSLQRSVRNEGDSNDFNYDDGGNNMDKNRTFRSKDETTEFRSRRADAYFGSGKRRRNKDDGIVGERDSNLTNICREPIHMHSFLNGRTGGRVKFKVFRGGVVEEWADGACVLRNVETLTMFRNGGILDDGRSKIFISREDRNALQMWLRLMIQNVRCKISFEEDLPSGKAEEEEEERANLEIATRAPSTPTSSDASSEPHPVAATLRGKGKVKKRRKKKRRSAICSFVDEDETEIQFEVKNGKLIERCDGVPVFVDCVERLVVNKDTGDVFDGQEIVPVPKRERKRVFRWLEAVAPEVSCAVIFEKNPEQSCAFVDGEGSKILFRIQGSEMEEWCDGEKVISAVKRVTIDKDGGAIFDGDAVLPVRRDDRERVFSWIVDADARVSCNIVYGKLVDKDGSDVDASNVVTKPRPSPFKTKKRSKEVKRVGEDARRRNVFPSPARKGDEHASALVAARTTSALPSIDDHPSKYIGFVVKEGNTREEFVVTSFRRGKVEFVSLSSSSLEDLSPVFECELKNFYQKGDPLSVERRATDAEMRLVRSLRKANKPDASRLGTHDALEQSTFCCNFTDEEGSLVEFVIQEGIMEEWCNGKLVRSSIDRIGLNEKEGVIDDGEVSILVRKDDRARVFRFLRQMAARASCTIGPIEKPKTGSLPTSEKPKTDSLPTFDGQKSELVGTVFEEIRTGEPFVIIAGGADDEIRYASLNPLEGDEANTFSCEQSNLSPKDLRLVRTATKTEIIMGESLWSKEHSDEETSFSTPASETCEKDAPSTLKNGRPALRAHDLLEKMNVSLLYNGVRWDAIVTKVTSTHVHISYLDKTSERVPNSDVAKRSFHGERTDPDSPRTCTFTDEDGSYVEFVFRQTNQVLEEWCDGKLVAAAIKKVTIDKDGGTVHDGAELIPIRQDDRARVFSWIVDVLRNATSCDVGYAKLVARDGSDVDMSNVVMSPRSRSSSIDSLVRAAAATSLKLNLRGKQLLPVARHALDSSSIASPRPRTKTIAAAATPRSKRGERCLFRDEDETVIEFVVSIDGAWIEEWCDGTLETKMLRRLDLDRTTGVIFDGLEPIPVRRGDVLRVFDWLKRQTSKAACRTTLSIANESFAVKDADLDTSKEAADLTSCCNFADEEGSQLRFARLDSGDLREWCDGAVVVDRVENISIDESRRSLCDGEETVLVTAKDAVRVFAWFKRMSSTLDCSITFVGRKRKRIGADLDLNDLVFQPRKTPNRTPPPRQRTKKVKIAGERTNARAPTTPLISRTPRGDDSSRCAFYDEDETFVEFVVVPDVGSIQEWCDGKLEVDRLKRVTLNYENRTIHDEVELIPVRRGDVDKVFSWFRKLRSRFGCDVIEIGRQTAARETHKKGKTSKRKLGARDETLPVAQSAQKKKSAKTKKLNRKMEKKKKTATKNAATCVEEKKDNDEDSCSFTDMDGTEIKFIICSKRLEEWCDGEIESRSLKTIFLNRKDGVLHDGEEDIPLWQKDIPRVFRWMEVKVAKETECVVTADCVATVAADGDGVTGPRTSDPKKTTKKASVSKSEAQIAPKRPMKRPPKLEVYKRPSGLWVAKLHKDKNGNGKTTQLGVFATRERAVKRWTDRLGAAKSSADATSSQRKSTFSPDTVCDDIGIMLSSPPILRDTPKSTSPRSVAKPVSVSVSSSRGSFDATKKSVCDFLDADNSRIKFVAHDGVLEEWVDGELVEGELKLLHVDRERSTIFDSKETIPILERNREYVFAWLRGISGHVSCAVEFTGDDDAYGNLPVGGMIADGGGNVSSFAQRKESDDDSCSFTDEDGTLIEFVVRGSILEEWCDGEQEISDVQKIVVVSNTIDDGDEIIPVRKQDRDRIFEWLRSVSSRVSCDITFVTKSFVASSRTHVHDGDAYYAKLQLGEHIISEGDFIRIKLDKNETVCGESVDVGVAQVLCMWEDVYKEMWVEHRWMYYPEATRQGRLPVHHRFEVLESDHVEENVVDVIHAKIDIVEEDAPDVALSRDTYLCNMFYSSQVGLVRKVSGKDRVERGMSYSRRKAMDFGVYHSLKIRAGGSDPSSDVDEDAPEDGTQRSAESSGTRKFSDACKRLQLSAIPPSLPCRESERHQVESFVREAIESGGTRTASSLYISGLPGTGKTATVLEVIRGLHREQKEGLLPPFRFLEINAMRLKHPRDIYSEVYRFIGPSQSRGYVEGDTSDKWGNYREWGHYTKALDAAQLLTAELSKPCPKRQFAVILVDELDFLKTKTQKVLYNLLEWPTWRHSRLLVVGIANTMDLPERLLPKLTSRLALQRIVFKPYSRQQIQQIVTARLKGLAAFREEAIEMCARKVSSISGDVRRALQICRRAAENRLFECRKPRSAGIAASEHQSSTVSPSLSPLSSSFSSSKNGGDLSRLLEISDVNQAVRELSQGHMTVAIRDAALYERIWLVALALHLRSTGLESANFADVHPRFKSLCVTHPEVAADPVPGPEQVLRMCERLAGSNIIFLQPSSDAGVRIPNVELNCQIEDVAWALSEDPLSKWLPA